MFSLGQSCFPLAPTLMAAYGKRKEKVQLGQRTSSSNFKEPGVLCNLPTSPIREQTHTHTHTCTEEGVQTHTETLSSCSHTLIRTAETHVTIFYCVRTPINTHINGHARYSFFLASTKQKHFCFARHTNSRQTHPCTQK